MFQKIPDIVPVAEAQTSIISWLPESLLLFEDLWELRQPAPWVSAHQEVGTSRAGPVTTHPVLVTTLRKSPKSWICDISSLVCAG